jgi:peptidoglycan/LPS O-acetylase OafA/YrhL
MNRIPSLDGLRAISVSLVLFGHLARAGHTPSSMSVYAGAGVQMFFVISGYLITTILLKEHHRTATIDLRQFYIRRAYRILPPASVFMLFVLVMYWRQFRWIDIGAMLLYLINYDSGRPWVIGHLWSLGVEEQFYFLWPSALRRWYRYQGPDPACRRCGSSHLSRDLLSFQSSGGRIWNLSRSCRQSGRRLSASDCWFADSEN